MEPLTAPDYPSRIKNLRQRYGLSQKRLAALMGVSFATVNRWENGHVQPTLLAQKQIARAEILGIEALGRDYALDLERPPGIQEERAGYFTRADAAPPLDFSAPAEIVRLVVEGERLAYGHLFNPAFAAETSRLDPLPHQRLAVYEHMLTQPRLRFLLADDAGAGKTIMAGLYIREMLARRLIQRVLIVPPAGLVSNWEREMNGLFSLPFQAASGGQARAGNPLIGPDGDLRIVSLDTLAGGKMFAHLQAAETPPYDLVIFDEAHKLAADREPDFRVRKTDRYRLAEALAGVRTDDAAWQLSWSARHLLLLTATPHMGKDYPYYCLWRLLEPELLSTFDAFSSYPQTARRAHFIRRTKEEMVRFDGSPIYPRRVSDTLSYDLTQGAISEQRLYEETTTYIDHYYNRARMLNRSAARLAMSIFQRRLASSTYALLCSFENRLKKLENLIEDIRSGKLNEDQLKTMQRRLDALNNPLDEKTAEEEEPLDGQEESEALEAELLAGVLADSLPALETERLQVQKLRDLARQVEERQQESKFERLRQVLQHPDYKDEKVILFTEHRDTLNFLVRRLVGIGYGDRVAQIHGGMSAQADPHTGLSERDEQVEFFRRPLAQDGARFLVATDAAGEGINLQFCWLMVNYDIPWNPARLEQRMGRIHRYKQAHDPVLIINLVAGATREGRVLKTLLEKMERMRKELGSDKVFDVVGRLFEGLSLRTYMERLLGGASAASVEHDLEGRLTPEQVRALEAREKKLFGEGGEVCSNLPRLQEDLAQEAYRRLLPGYVRRFVEQALPLLEIGVDGAPALPPERALEGEFSLRPLKTGALDPLWPALEMYPDERRQRLAIYKTRLPQNDAQAEPIYLRPGEPLFEHLRRCTGERFGRQALRGAVFIDPTAGAPYLFHLAHVEVLRQADPEGGQGALARQERLVSRLVGLRQETDGSLSETPLEILLLLKSGDGRGASAIGLAASARGLIERAHAHLLENTASSLASERRRALEAALPERRDFLKRGYDYQEAELAAARSRLSEKARDGDPRARGELTKIKARQKALAVQYEAAVQVLRREPELIIPGEITFLAHALVVPSDDPQDRKRHDKEIEAVAVQVVTAYEQARGARVIDVSTPERALAAGLSEYPGFDLLSYRPDGQELDIEVKGRAGTGEVELSENEILRSINLQEKSWLCVVYDCASSLPRLVRIHKPWRLHFNLRSSAIFEAQTILAAAEPEERT